VPGGHEAAGLLHCADGVVRAQNGKIIFTANLPNIGSIDDALLHARATELLVAHLFDRAQRRLQRTVIVDIEVVVERLE
jgi:hypothetical protein